jgi:hypothetical protein
MTPPTRTITQAEQSHSHQDLVSPADRCPGRALKPAPARSICKWLSRRPACSTAGPRPGAAWRIGPQSNRCLLVNVAVQATGQATITYLPAMNHLFHTAPVTGMTWLQHLV